MLVINQTFRGLKISISTKYTYILRKLHVLCVDTENLKTANFVWHTDVNFPIEPTKPSESRINAVWAICRPHYDNMCT